jgi:uncharacterized protein (TIGR04255 family)
MTANLRTPPVNEVALAVCFEPEDLLAGPMLPEMLGSVFVERAAMQTVPPYTMPVENEHLAAAALPFQLQQIMPDPRYWITSSDPAYLTQVQTSYIALNWRKQEANPEYVHYTSLRSRFGDLVEMLRSNLARYERRLVPIQAELTYVNVVSPDLLWSHLGDVHNVFRANVGSERKYEQLSFNFSQRIIDTDGSFVGRLHVTMQPGIDPLKDEPRLNLNITARSTTLAWAPDAYLQFLDSAHDIANATFLDLLTPAAKSNWGLA